MTDATFLTEDNDLHGRAPALNNRRAALTALAGPQAPEDSRLTAVQFTAVSACALLAGLAGLSLTGAGLGEAVAAGVAGLVIGYGALRAGCALQARARRKAALSAGLVVLGLVALAGVGAGWLWIAGLLAPALVVGMTGYRRRRDMFTEHLLRGEIEAQRAALRRDDDAFRAELDAMRADVESQIADLSRKAGLKVDRKRSERAP